MKKWYLQTWFICILFIFWPLIVPPIAGIVLLILQYREQKKANEKYGTIDILESNIKDLSNQKSNLYDDIDNLQAKAKSETEKMKHESEKLKTESQNELNEIKSEINDFNKELTCEHYLFSEYDGITSEECKNQLTVIKNEEKDAIKNDEVLEVSGVLSKKALNNNSQQILRSFNSECDNVLLNLSCKTIDASRNKITKSFETLNRIFAVDGIQMKQKLLEYKLKELNLVYTYELKKEQEKEQQKAIKEQMIEEEKVRREIERQKIQIEKDQSQFNNEINKLMAYVQKTSSDVEKQLYIDKIQELQGKLKELEEQKSSVLEREANAKAGYVYVISNIGSFGEDVYKIGMTRRLEPMDRVDELGSASVPFEFDVHAMIFSADAPSLETALHQAFNLKRVNRVNSRKEFFRVTLDEIESVVKSNYNNTVEFTRIPVAKEYNETLEILKQETA